MIIAEVQRGTSMSGWGDLIEAHSNLPGIDSFTLLATPAEWRQFIADTKAGKYDLDDSNHFPVLEHNHA